MKQTFVVGDRVIWSDYGSDYWKRKNVEQYGEGPFEVKGTKEVPKKECNCTTLYSKSYPRLLTWLVSFLPEKKDSDHHPQCHQVLINPDTVGHHQWVTIPGLGLGEWSGAWFNKYEPAA